mgnify:CR=1 FL=1
MRSNRTRSEMAQAEFSQTNLPTATGLTDPTLSFNLDGVSDWSTQMPFLDIAHSMRPWIGHVEQYGWGGMSYQALLDGGYLDEQGWLKEIPEGVFSVGTAWAWSVSSEETPAAASRAGIYVLTYEGEGTIQLKQGAHVLSTEPGRIVFENPTGTTMEMVITETDPDRSGDYIRNISIVPEQYEALAQTGELFNPEWLAVIEDARQLRFMDWMKTNNSGLAEWGDRPELGDATWSADGVPVEVMVQLANQTGADPWFTMPHLASDDYVRQFATYVRDHLDPELVAHVEYSNETWNWAFQQTHWLRDQATTVWGSTDGAAYLDYGAKRATETALIWDAVFGAEADARVENVLGLQTGGVWAANRKLTAPTWAESEPDAYVAPHSVFDALAVTTYFGSTTVSDADMRADLLEAIQDPETDATAWLADRLMDPEYTLSIPQIEAFLANMRSIADAYGLDILAYEGGQHVQHSFAVSDLTDAELATLTDFLGDFVRSPQMADLYAELWDVWVEVSDGPFMQFGDVAAPSKYGSWGLLSALGDTNPRAEFLFEQNETAQSWFGDGGGTRYQQGVIRMAGDDGETLTGTDKDDFLVGGDGDDTFIGGAGDDAFNGGRGEDFIDGGEGVDTASYAGETGGIGVSLGENAAWANASGDTLSRIENLIGSRYEDVLIGDDQDNSFEGNGGNDTLEGRYGNDTLIGGSGDDTLDGGVGDDSLYGGFGNDFLYGGVGDDILNGGRGADLINGGKGQDWAVYADSSAGVSVDLDGINTGGDAEGDTLFEIENVKGSIHDDIISMDDTDNQVAAEAGNDLIFGFGGKDIIYGGGGNDRISGGTGKDVLFGEAGSDIIVFNLGDGSDLVADFENGVDFLELDCALWGGSLTAEEIVDTFAKQVGANQIDFDFGKGDVLRVISGSLLTLADLYDNVMISGDTTAVTEVMVAVPLAENETLQEPEASAPILSETETAKPDIFSFADASKPTDFGDLQRLPTEAGFSADQYEEFDKSVSPSDEQDSQMADFTADRSSVPDLWDLNGHQVDHTNFSADALVDHYSGWVRFEHWWNDHGFGLEPTWDLFGQI